MCFALAHVIKRRPTYQWGVSGPTRKVGCGAELCSPPATLIGAYGSPRTPQMSEPVALITQHHTNKYPGGLFLARGSAPITQDPGHTPQVSVVGVVLFGSCIAGLQRGHTKTRAKV